MPKPQQLLQIQTQEQQPSSVALKVKFPHDMWDHLQKIQIAIGLGPLVPAPSIHALVLKAVRNYIQDFHKRKARS